MNRPGRWWIAALPAALVVLSGAILIEHRAGSAATPSTHVVQPTRRANFAVSITTTGELRARKYVEILGPHSQESQVFQTKITWLIPEGTTVKAGDRVAELDRGPAETRRQAVLLEMQKADGEYTNAVLDSALALAQAREDVRTAEYAIEEKKLARDQAQYEAPTLKRQAQIDFDRAGRALDQARRSLETKTKQAIAKLGIAGANLERSKNNLRAVQDAVDEFTVHAPSDGMVIYLRTYNGRPKGVGSSYYIFDPVVATLPDLNEMQSLTYVNEVDVHRVAVGQPVEISLDAEPAKRLAGRVISVANVGEQHPGEDAKVFEVVVDLAKADTTLRPGMTTANAIQLRSEQNVLTVPLRAVVAEGERRYVYKESRGGVVRQQVRIGPAGATDVVVTRGLSDADHILLDPPAHGGTVRTLPLPAR